ncbi:hypothetical protein LJR009_003080 [Bosea sp. LjRoot9]
MNTMLSCAEADPIPDIVALIASMLAAMSVQAFMFIPLFCLVVRQAS